MGLLVSLAVAAQATGAGLLAGVIGEDEYLGFVAATFHVFPTFLDETKATMARLQSFAQDTDPLVKELEQARSEER